MGKKIGCPSDQFYRHEIIHSERKIGQVARHALTSTGRIAMAHVRPMDTIEDNMRQVEIAHWKRIQFIYPKMGRGGNMLLIEVEDGSTKVALKTTVAVTVVVDTKWRLYRNEILRWLLKKMRVSPCDFQASLRKDNKAHICGWKAVAIL